MKHLYLAALLVVLSFLPVQAADVQPTSIAFPSAAPATNYQLLPFAGHSDMLIRFSTLTGDVRLMQLTDNVRENGYELEVQNENRVRLLNTTDPLVAGRFSLTYIPERSVYLLFDSQEGKLWMGTFSVLRQRWSVAWRPFTPKR